MEFDLENPLPPSNENFPALFNKENDHMPSKNYIHSLISSGSNLAIRREIASSIVDISREFDPFLPYLAVNYMDRFLSAQSIPDGKPWIFRLVSVCCISLALKMRKTEFSVSDLTDDGGLMFNSVTIERMEMLILGALQWRMRSINPFSFVNYFISFFKSDDKPSIQSLKNRATEIILKAQNDIKLLEFKPSIMAASALLSASYEFFPMQFQPFRDAICGCFYVIKEDLQHCYDIMQEAAAAGCSAAVLRSLTPANVLDFSSSISDSQSNEMSEAGISGSEIRGIRRQKIEHFATNISSQLSQKHQ
ncbi:hypothetical protein C2S51_003947 [Perilla frutescens var. frutescens]|nr:hypothetical protein C2S51_003947 [Perilla frutescens var. frutescens]